MRVGRETFHRVLAEFPEAAVKVRAELGARMRKLVDGLDAARIRSLDGVADAGTSGRAMRTEAGTRPLGSARADIGRPRYARRDAFAQLPASFRRLCEGLVIQVVDFPDNQTLDQMGAQSEFDLLGLFRGQGLAQRGAVAETGALPNIILACRAAVAGFLVPRRRFARRRGHACPGARDRPSLRPLGRRHRGDRAIGDRVIISVCSANSRTPEAQEQTPPGGFLRLHKGVTLAVD